MSVIRSVKNKAIDGTRFLTRQFQIKREFKRDNRSRRDLSLKENITILDKVKSLPPGTSQCKIVEIYVKIKRKFFFFILEFSF